MILTNNNRTDIMIEAKGEDVLYRTFSLIFNINSHVRSNLCEN